MPRRVHVTNLTPGQQPLTERAAHHIRDVLRLREGQQVELFDDRGQTALATIVTLSTDQVLVEPGPITPAAASPLQWTIASAVPKGNRADWLIEKLSELGTGRFIPLQTTRSVVHPEGAGKLDRWRRIAEESAKQSHRVGVMKIATLQTLHEVISASPDATLFCLDPGASSQPIISAIQKLKPLQLIFFIGPEGGWTDEELLEFDKQGSTRVLLAETFLRVETAAVLAAGVASLFNQKTGTE